MSPFFSIIIPVYNVAPYLRECLDSVLAQTFTDWEAICVDDGSTDGSDAILDEYARGDSRFKVIHQQNKGVAAARNMGLSIIKGEWIALLDGDDSIVCDALNDIFKALGGANIADVVYFGYNEVSEYNEQCKVVMPVADVGTHDISNNVPQSVIGSFGWQYVYRKDAINGIDFGDYVRGEDSYFKLMALSKIDSVLVIDKPLLNYRIRHGSAIHRPLSFRSWFDEYRFRADWLKRTTKKFGKSYIRSVATNIAEHSVLSANKFGVKEQAVFWGVWANNIKYFINDQRLPFLHRIGFRILAKHFSKNRAIWLARLFKVNNKLLKLMHL